LKFASYQTVELLGDIGLDFAVIDAEHAPFDRNIIDSMMIAGRAASLPLFVRVPDDGAATILSAVDMGATGIVVPHVEDADSATKIVSHVRYVGGTRGFSRATRAAGFGELPLADVLRKADEITIVCQIESQRGVANAREIASVPGVDVLFVGRADLAVSMGVDGESEEIKAAIKEVEKATKIAGKRLGMFVSRPDELPYFSDCDASWFIVGSDQAALRAGAKLVISGMREQVENSSRSRAMNEKRQGIRR